MRETIDNAENQENHYPSICREDSDELKIARRIAPGQKLCDVRGGAASVHSWEIPQVFGRTNKRHRELLCVLIKARRRLRLRSFGDADPVLPADLGSWLGRNCESDIAVLVDRGFLVRKGNRLDFARRFNGKFRRLRMDGVSNAVDTRFGDARYFLHPTENRGFSVREAARIQGFPDSFVLTGSRESQFKLIGNAVPIPMAKKVASAIRGALHL